MCTVNQTDKYIHKGRWIKIEYKRDFLTIIGRKLNRSEYSVAFR